MSDDQLLKLSDAAILFAKIKKKSRYTWDGGLFPSDVERIIREYMQSIAKEDECAASS